MSLGKQRTRAGLEVLAIASGYIMVSIGTVSVLDLGWVFPADWSSEEKSIGSGFLAGAIVQVALVLIAAYIFRIPEMREAISALGRAATTQAWVIAGIATAIHIGTAILVVLPQPERIWEISQFGVLLSLLPAADGWSQEVLFRGYVLIRLARASYPEWLRILLSGILFAAIHLGYTGHSLWDIAFPLIGTFMLGSFFAWATIAGKGSLRPVVCCHVLIIIVLQPWLALAH